MKKGILGRRNYFISQARAQKMLLELRQVIIILSVYKD